MYVHCEEATDEKDWEFLHDLMLNRPFFAAVGISWEIVMVLLYSHDALGEMDLYLLNNGQPTRLAECSGDPDTVINLALATGDLKD